MEIKRNIFESPAKMPPRYEPCAVPFTQEDTSDRPLPGHMKTGNDVVHARSPRVGEHK